MTKILSGDPKEIKMSTLANMHQTMSSTEIAKLTSKEHKNVLRDIRDMLSKLDGSDLSHERYQALKDKLAKQSEILNAKTTLARWCLR